MLARKVLTSYLGFSVQNVVICMELVVILVEVSHCDITTNHASSAFGSTDAECHIFILIHPGGQPDDYAIQHSFPLHLHPTVEQLDARIKIVL